MLICEWYIESYKKYSCTVVVKPSVTAKTNIFDITKRIIEYDV